MNELNHCPGLPLEHSINSASLANTYELIMETSIAELHLKNRKYLYRNKKPVVFIQRQDTLIA